MGRTRVKLFFDGGCRPNPGRIEAAVVLRGQVQYFGDLGTGNNRDAEWLALIAALGVAQAAGLPAFDLLGDAREVVLAAQAALRSGEAACPHGVAFLALAAMARPGQVRWVKRQQNLAGIALAARHPR
jgi:ribonuclease HI